MDRIFIYNSLFQKFKTTVPVVYAEFATYFSVRYSEFKDIMVPHAIIYGHTAPVYFKGERGKTSFGGEIRIDFKQNTCENNLVKGY